MAEKKQVTAMTAVAIASVPLIMTLGNSMLVPVLPEIQKQLDLTHFKVSLIITVFSFAAAIFIPIMGFISDHIKRKWVIIPSLILYGAGGLLAGLTGAGLKSYVWLLVGRVIQGIGAAGSGSIALALTGDLYQGAKRSKVLGAYEASNGFGKVLSPILGATFALIAWYWVFLAFPAFCLVAIFLTLFFVREGNEKKKGIPLKQYIKGLAEVFKSEGRWLVVAYFTGMVCLFTLFGVEFYLSNILEDTYHIVGLKKGFFLAIPIIIMCSVSLITGNKIGKNNAVMKRLIIFGLIIMTCSYIGLVFLKNLIPFLIVLSVGSIGTGLVLPCLNSYITGSVGIEKRGFVTSIYSSVRFIGVALGPPVISRLMDWSRSGMFYSIAGLTIFVMLLTLFFVRVKNNGKKDGEGEENHTLFVPLLLS